MRKLNKKNLINQQRTIIFILLFLVVTTMTIGYATYNKILVTNGLITIQAVDGNLEITDAVYTSGTSVTAASVSSFNELTANLSIRFTRNRNGTANYSVTITNNSKYDYQYTGHTFNAANSGFTATVSGIASGDTIPAKTSKTVTVTVSGRQNNTTTYNPTITFNLDNQPTGNVIGALNTPSINLTTLTRAPIDIIVYNTYAVDKVINLTLDNAGFYLVDTNDARLGNITIQANTSQTITAYVKITNGILFYTTPQTTGINLFVDNNSKNIGTLSIDVPIASLEEDTEPPSIGNVTLNIENTEGNITASWTRTDVGGSDVDYYKVLLYKGNQTEPTIVQVPGTQTSYTFTNQQEANYFVKVYGVDKAENSGETNGNNSCTTPEYTDDYCKKSTTEEAKWNFTVTNSIENSSIGNTTVKRGTYTTTLNANNLYTLNENTIQVKMDGVTVPHTFNNGTLTVENVTGNLEITGTTSFSGCLVEGTRILLANGTYKNIEDINYDDLLQVWNYETGSITYEYPIWIEKKEKAESYEKTTFSDGTILKTVKLHQVFSLDENKFVNILDEEYIKKGTRVAKVVNGKIVPITVTKVETIKEPVNYYYVASSIYYNIISEDIITTSDQITTGVTLSNMYGFEDNIKWPSIRNEIISKPNALFTYEDLSIMPYYLFYGSRGEETKLFVNLGYATTESLIEYLLNTQLDPSRAIPPITDNKGNRLWMVTTSDDYVTEDNKKDFLIKEGNQYTLKKPLIQSKKFKGWYNTIDGKIYQPGDKVTVIHGTHFIAIYK